MVSGNITSRVTTLKGADAQTGKQNASGIRWWVLNTLTLVLSDYGRNYGVVYDALGYTDMLPEFGGDTAYSDDFFVGRVGGVATYRNPTSLVWLMA